MAGSDDSIRPKLDGCRVFVVPYCHADWAWTHTRRWHELRYIKVFEDVLAILNEQERAGVSPAAPEAFRWYMDSYCMELVPFLRARPERVDELRRRVSSGRIGVCGGYANVRINHVHGETFVRSLIYGRRAFERVFPDADLSVHSDIVDVAVGHPQLPQLLRLGGYRYLQFWRPHEALNAKGVPQQFIWRGLDGSEVIAARGQYGGGWDAAVCPPEPDDAGWDAVVRTWWERWLQERQAYSPTGVLWVQQGGDDSRPLRSGFYLDTPVALPTLIEAWNQRECSSVRFATPGEVFAVLEAERERLPAIVGTLDPCDVCYNSAWAGADGLWRLREQCAQAILIAETLGALLAGVGRASEDVGRVQATCEELWRNTLVLSAHAMQWLFQDDFDDVQDLARTTLSSARALQRRLLGELVDGTQLPGNPVAVVYNPLPFERRATVPVRITFVEGDTGGLPDTLRLIDIDGKELPFQIRDEMWHVKVRWEADLLLQIELPAGGWNVVCWAAGAPAYVEVTSDSCEVLENEVLRLEFERGHLIRIVEKDRGKTWSAPDECSFGHLRAYDVDTTAPLHVGRTMGHADACWETWRVTERGPVRQTLRCEGHVGAHRATLEARLYRGERRVEFAVWLDCAGMDGFIAAHAPLPDGGRLVGDMPFCVEDKDLGAEPYVGIERRREGMFIAQSFVDWTDGDSGMCYVSHDGDRYYVFDRQGGTLGHILVNSVRPVADGWERHVNRQRDALGEHNFTFSVLPHAGDWREAELWRRARALRTPAICDWPRAVGDRPLDRSLLRLEPANVSLSAFYREGDCLLLRVCESAGQAVEATIVLPFVPADVQCVDLLGVPMRDGGPGKASPGIASRDRTLSFPLGSWQIVTIAVTIG